MRQYTYQRCLCALFFAVCALGWPASAQAQPTLSPTSNLISVASTSVRSIYVIRATNMRTAPDTGARVLAVLKAGQTLQVTGISANSQWWRVRCPDGSIGNCFVSANQFYTKAGNAPSASGYTQNLQLWQSKRIANYQIQIQRICFCVPEITKAIVVDVRGGRVVSSRYADGSPIPASAAAHFANASTIDQLFALISNATNQRYAKVEATYNPTYGFPQSIYLDQDAMMADEEVGYSISNFRVLP